MPIQFDFALATPEILLAIFGMAILIVEQNVREALKISDRVIVMKSGAVIREGTPADFSDNAALMELY